MVPPEVTRTTRWEAREAWWVIKSWARVVWEGRKGGGGLVVKYSCSPGVEVEGWGAVILLVDEIDLVWCGIVIWAMSWSLVGVVVEVRREGEVAGWSRGW